MTDCIWAPHVHLSTVLRDPTGGPGDNFQPLSAPCGPCARHWNQPMLRPVVYWTANTFRRLASAARPCKCNTWQQNRPSEAIDSRRWWCERLRWDLERAAVQRERASTCASHAMRNSLVIRHRCPARQLLRCTVLPRAVDKLAKSRWTQCQISSLHYAYTRKLERTHELVSTWFCSVDVTLGKKKNNKRFITTVLCCANGFLHV